MVINEFSQWSRCLSQLTHLFIRENFTKPARVFLAFLGSSLLLQISRRSRGVSARRFGGIVVISELETSKLKMDEDVCDDEG